MSVQAAKDFMRTARKDPDLKEQVDGALMSEGDARADRIVAIGAAAGFTFTGADIESVIAEAAGAELSEDQLGHVAGGVSWKTAVGTLWNYFNGGGGGDSGGTTSVIGVRG